MKGDERGELWPFDVEKLESGDVCEYRYEAVAGWHHGTVVKNGGSYYWTIKEKDGKEINLWIERIRTVRQA